MAGFGSLNAAELDPEAVTAQPEETWQDREAQAALKLIEAENANKAAAGRGWYDTINDVAHFPHRMFGQLTSPRPDDPVRMMPENYVYRTINNTADAISGAIKSGVTAPGDALSGELPMTDAEGHTSPEAISRGFDLASIAGGGSVAGTAERAARSAGTDFRVLGRKIGGEVDPASAIKITPVSELAAPYHEALEGGTTLASDSAKPGAVIAAAEHAPPFTTAAEPALERIGRKVGTAEQWKNDLAKYGVTKEEMKYRGVDELKPGQPLSREQLATHLESNPVEIKPIDRVSPEWDNLTSDQQYKVADAWQRSRYPGNFDNPREYFDDVIKPNPEDFGHVIGGSPPKYPDYQLPGGENYRERLLTLPPKVDRTELQAARNQNAERISDLRAEMHGTSGSDAIRAEIRRLQNESDGYSQQIKEADASNYKSGHWEEPNVIVHRRSTDREMPVPFTPEEQAAVDARAAAQGRLRDLRRWQGSVGTEIRQAAKPLRDAHYEQIRADMKARKISGGEGLRQLEAPFEHPELKPLQDRLQALRAEEDALNKSLPPEPKPKTIKTLHDEEQQSDWHQTGAKEGYGPKPRIPFEDYWKQTQIGDLEHADPARIARQRALYEREGQNVVNQSNRVPDGPFKDSWHRLALHDQIREAAEKGFDRISWTGGKSSPTNPKNLGRTGEEAEKAERGLIKHYDEKLVNAANKIGKAHGVQVEKSDVAGYRNVNNYDSEPGQHFPTKAAAEKWAAENPAAAKHWKQEPIDAYHMDIPQSLKDQALKKGFSMFEDSGKAGGAIAAAEHAKPYHDLLDKAPAAAEHGFGPLDSHPHERALTINDILHPDTPAMKTNSRTVEEIAKSLHDRGSAALEKMGVEGGRIEQSAPRTDELLSRGIASEIKAALSRGDTASDWYTHKIAEAMDIASEMHPELKNNPHQKMGFTTALAVTSQGEMVVSNVRLANQVYEHFKKTGRFPTNVEAKNGPAMNANFQKMNDLLKSLGPEGTREFLHKEFTVKELEQAGYDVGGENKQTKVYGSAILGPKIGQGFYQNLNGNYKPVTMDLWFMRAWGRMTGTLVGKTDVAKPTARLQDALRAEGIRVPRDPAKLAKLADDAVLAHERDFRANRKLYDSGKRSKSELTYAAERFQKNTTGINEQPTSGSQRAWMRSVVDRARGILAENGHKVTNADLQAIWWYPEKELYAKLGGRDSDKVNVDYATAFRDLKNKGATNGQEAGAVRPLERRSGPAAKANDASTVGRGSRGSQKADGPKVKFGSLAPGAD